MTYIVSDKTKPGPVRIERWLGQGRWELLGTAHSMKNGLTLASELERKHGAATFSYRVTPVKK